MVVCGTGIGEAIAANKVAGVRAAVVTSDETARLTRLHNDSNVLALGGRTNGQPRTPCAGCASGSRPRSRAGVTCPRLEKIAATSTSDWR